MTMNEIRAWIDKRMNQQQRRDYSSYGKTDRTRVEFAGGDVFEQITEYVNMWNTSVKITINGKEVYNNDYKWNNFGWMEA